MKFDTPIAHGILTLLTSLVGLARVANGCGISCIEDVRYKAPVRVGEVTDPALFRWSSAAAYVGARRAEGFLSCTEVWRHFARRARTAQQRYREFLRDGMAPDVARPWERVVAQTLLGDERWVQRMRRRFTKKMPATAAEVPAARQLRARPPLSAVVAQVCRATGAQRADLLRPAGGHSGWPRAVAMYLGCNLCGLTQRAVAVEFGVSHFGISKAIRRVEELKRTNRTVTKMIDRVSTALQT